MPKYDLIKISTGSLCKSIMTGMLDHEVLSDALWAISYSSEGPKARIQRVVETNITDKLVEMMASDFKSLSIPAMRIVGNISTGN